MSFERETATFDRERQRLLEQHGGGRFALIRGDEVHSVWDTSGDAHQAGLLVFGLGSGFMTKEIRAVDRVYRV